MTAALSGVSGVGAILVRDARIFFSYRLSFVTQALSALFGLTIFYFVSRFVDARSFGSPDEYFAFVAVGLVIARVLYSCLGMPAVVQQELAAGTFERLVVSPLGAVKALGAMMIFPFLSSALLGALIVALAGAVFGAPIHWATVPLAFPVALLGMVAFAPFGVLLGALALVVKQAGIASAWMVALISLVAGVYFPAELLPGWVAWVSDVQPFTPALDLLRHLLVGAALTGPAVLDVLKLTGFAVLLTPLAAAALAAAVRHGRRRGTLLEY
jgi:ABC-2 type transport system permease protein